MAPKELKILIYFHIHVDVCNTLHNLDLAFGLAGKGDVFSSLVCFCHDAGNVAIYALWEPKTVNPGFRARKTEIPALSIAVVCLTCLDETLNLEYFKTFGKQITLAGLSLGNSNCSDLITIIPVSLLPSVDSD